ncbi:hypothetical protein ACN42_g5349 [Penicillium freii]|uniref:FAD/NAD(P)-binding domain-containing protein n=1 Tax=Penicillium freii TaxID=48697 RepID=A0A117NP41_PENFR|nr:hypothetical protein ACN42_g5349 [Penicillium freii]
MVRTSSQAICRPAWPRALISDDIFPQEKLFVGVPQQFEQCPEDSFRFIQGTATKLDHHDRYVTASLKEGRQYREDGIPYAYHRHRYIHCVALTRTEWRLSKSLRATWETFREALPNVKHIVIAGGGLTGVETAGELGEYLNGGADWFSSKLENPKVTITLVTAGSKILPVLRPDIAKKAENFLAQVGVTVVTGSRVATVSPTGTGTESALTTNATWCAIGDVGSHARPAVHNILNTVPTLCANIKRDLLLAEEKEESTAGADRVFKEDTRETQLVPIGKSKGVGAAMGFQ